MKKSPQKTLRRSPLHAFSTVLLLLPLLLSLNLGAVEVFRTIEPPGVLPSVGTQPWGADLLSGFKPTKNTSFNPVIDHPDALKKVHSLASSAGISVNFWTVQVKALNATPVGSGTVLYVEFWMRTRTTSDEKKTGYLTVGVRTTSSPAGIILTENMKSTLEQGWVRQAVAAKVASSAEPGGLELYLQFNRTADQTVEVADFRVVGLEPSVELAALPVTTKPPAPLSAEEVKPWDPKVHYSKVTGATIDETEIRQTLTINPEAPETATNYRTLRAGLAAARDALSKAIPTKLLISPGTYREAVTDVNWQGFPTRDALLVLEAAPGGEVIWSGADPLPANQWKDEGRGLWSHPLKEVRPPVDYPWGMTRRIGWQSEQLFIGSRPARQVILDVYDAKPWPRSSQKPVFTFKERRDPAMSLTAPFTFGVSAQPPEGPRVYLRLPVGQKPSDDIEYTVRPSLVNFGGKSNLVIRGITFQRCNTASRWDEGVIRWAPDNVRNVLIENCRFLWNNAVGLNIPKSQNWTLRNIEAAYNGKGGISTGDNIDLLFEKVTTNFNGWRALRAGDSGFAYGGVKFHNTVGVVVRGHTAIGNVCAGPALWWDINCKRALVEDSVLAFNRGGIQWEISQGPFVARRTLIAMNESTEVNWWQTGSAIIENSLLVGNGDGPSSASVLFGIADWRKDVHGTVESLVMGLHMIRDSVVVALGKNQAIQTHWLVNRAPGMNTLTYRGFRNTFWSPDSERALWLSRSPQDRNIGETYTLAQTIASGEETDSVWRDPGLRDPQNGDFRFREDSPLKDRKELPQWVIQSETQEKMRAFFQWVGYSPTVTTELNDWE